MDAKGSTFSLVDVKDNFGKGKQQVQATSEGENQEQVPFSSLHSTSHFTLYDHNNPQPIYHQEF
ncbi:hypothetical protein [uncultured Nostoc sp.]|uniref:hypothetical protein n=1 Tax=uncultured Nostoc sp. TaxID=340711 RepID=UPI0035CB5398